MEFPARRCISGAALEFPLLQRNVVQHHRLLAGITVRTDQHISCFLHLRAGDFPSNSI